MTCGQSVFDTTCLGGFTQNSTGYKDYHPRKLYKELCKLEPEEGRSLNTNFSITCTGGNPLYIVRYEFSYVLQNGLHEVLYQGSERSYRTVLLSGISTIKAVIIDGRGNKTEFSLNVKVKSIASTCEDWIRKINMYFRRGDKTLGAWSLLESLLSINGSVKKCPQLDEIVLNLTSDMKMETTQDVLKVTLLLGTMLDGMEDVSTSALLRTTNILKKIVKHIREDFRIPGSRLDSSFSAVVENVLFNLGKALKIGSQNSNFTNYDRTGFNTNINATKTLLSLKDQIIEVLRLSLKNVTTRNYTMQSKYLSITVVSLRGGEVDNFTIVAGQSRFIIPDINPVGEVISFLEMWTTPFNPFTWDQTSERVTSHVAGLEVRDEKGDIINMSDPSREITVILPLDKKTTDKILKGSTYYRRMKINHNITVQYGQSFVNVSFMPQSSDLVISKVKVISATTQNYSECENVRDKWIKRGRIHCNGNVAVSFMAINPGRYLVDAIFTVKESKMKKITQSSKPERGKATCVTIKNPPAVNEVKYISVQVSESACLFWETETSAWKTTGCRVEKVISNSGLKCACNHLTSFGGAYLVPPNDLSFVKVLQELRSPNDSGKFLVLVVLIATILLYLVAIIFARREDRRDKAKIQDSVPPVFYRSSESANCRYELTIKTGVWLGSGTTANVSFVLFGVEGRSSTLTIQQDFYAGFHPKFARGTEHKFAAILDKDLGDIYKLHVSHDNSGYNPSWFLDYIKIIPAGTDKSWKFSFDTWLSLEDESLSNECIRSPSNAQGSVTGRALHEMLSDGHLWMSIITKTPGSCFSRVQRISSCLCLLYCTMAVNAMFYSWSNQPSQTINLGPLRFSAQQAMTSIQSILFIVPIHIIITLFRKASARPQNRFWRCFLYLTWGLLCLVTAMSAGLTVSYSLMWGSEKSQEWISSVSVSFFQDVLILQPFKCFLLAMLWSVFSNCRVRKVSSSQQFSGKTADDNRSSASTKSSKLSASRRKSVAMARRRLMIRQTLFYIFFFVVIGILTYGKRDFSRYLLFKSLADHTESFEEVKDKTSLWNWINGSLITYLYSTNQESSELASTVIGMVRIRQLRVRKAQCPADKITNWWQQTCLESYSRKNEHSEPFHPTKGTSPLQFNRCPIPWMYKTGKELGSSSKWGRHAWYGGGGYLAELGYEEETARAITNLLQSESWVDRQTSAIVLEFSLLNSGTNILAVSSFFVEFLPTGQATVKRSINIISLYDTEAILQIFQGMCLVFFIAMVLFIIGETIAHIVRRRWRYLCSFWCLLDLGHLATSILLLVSSFMKSYLTTTSVLRLKENMFAHTSFETPLLWAEVENSLLAILTFLATLKLLQLTYFNFYTRLFSCALRIWMHDLPSFCLVLSIIFLAFLEIGVLVFGPSIGRYSSFWRAFAFQLEITLGKVRTRPIKELAEGVPIFGHVLVVSLLFSITIVLMNFFVSTLNDALAEAKTAEMDKEAEQAMTVGRPVNITVEKADGVNVAPENKDNGRKGEKIRGGEKTERGSRAILFDKVSKGLKTKAFFDEISEQLKTIDTLQLPILRLKVDKVCRRIENAIANEIDTGEPSTVNQKGKRRVHFGSSVRIPFT
ncbi:polycystic kidney disease protein 1-like 2 [Stylophora pistillata]|uniref:polycystic kidney disease protein 1-like 2 n=1 Tax=Stylophora pistillata TaxID=50429 RepID=UPI000C04E04C|nr:polycystic kidney disease protein 1-like 2 [Stylophora pistillata]